MEKQEQNKLVIILDADTVDAKVATAWLKTYCTIIAQHEHTKIYLTKTPEITFDDAFHIMTITVKSSQHRDKLVNLLEPMALFNPLKVTMHPKKSAF